MAAVLSLVIDAVLIAVVILLAGQLHSMRQTMSGLIGGLYNNFGRMDAAVISTTIAVNDITVPVSFTQPVVLSSTDVTLTQDVTIHGANVVINTGSISINAPATVTLPRGTILPVAINMSVPVKTTLTLNLQLPVEIKIATASSPVPGSASLHQALVGLQNTLGPFYCLLQPQAQDYQGQYLCQQGVYAPQPVP